MAEAVTRMSQYLPVMWNVEEVRCTVIGGGGAARRKVSALLEAGIMEVVVIAPIVAPEMDSWAGAGRVKIVRKVYEGESDLLGSGLVFTATDDSAVNEQVCADARRLGIPVLDAGNPERGTFILPAVLRRGRLIMAVSTSGASPRLAVRLRDELAEQYGQEYADIVEREVQDR